MVSCGASSLCLHHLQYNQLFYYSIRNKVDDGEVPSFRLVPCQKGHADEISRSECRHLDPCF